MESLTKEYASPVCVCMQLRKAGRVVTQIYDRCLRPVGIRGTQFALLKRIACMRRPFITDIGKVLCMDQTTATRNIGLLERAGLLPLACTTIPEEGGGTDARRAGQAGGSLSPVGRGATGNQGIPRRRQTGQSVLPASGSERFLQRMKVFSCSMYILNKG